MPTYLASLYVYDPATETGRIQDWTSVASEPIDSPEQFIAFRDSLQEDLGDPALSIAVLHLQRLDGGLTDVLARLTGDLVDESTRLTAAHWAATHNLSIGEALARLVAAGRAALAADEFTEPDQTQ